MRQLRRSVGAAAVALAAWGCGPPEIAPATPPGIELTRVSVLGEGEQSEALGEQAGTGVASAPAGATKATVADSPPTENGQTASKPSGLKYATQTPGKGASVKPGQKVTVHYKGTLESNGEVIDSSFSRNEPLTFVLGEAELIKGWHEGIAGMKQGERRKLTIPPHLAYGTLGRPPKVPGNATLVFEIDLLKFE